MRLGPLTQNQAPKYRRNESAVLIGLSVVMISDKPRLEIIMEWDDA